MAHSFSLAHSRPLVYLRFTSVVPSRKLDIANTCSLSVGAARLEPDPPQPARPFSYSLDAQLRRSRPCRTPYALSSNP